jgi:hypothetical protein
MRLGKVAVCISGLPRTAIAAYPIFKNFFQSTGNYDVFYHTWSGSTSNDELDQIQLMYNPVNYTVQDPLTTDNGSFGNMLYSIMSANDLKKRYELDNNFRYDLVIRTRFDLVFPEKFRFPIDGYNSSRTIYCSGGNQGINHTDYENHGINDILFWGDSQAMDIATNTYLYYKHRALAANTELMQEQGKKFDPGNAYYSAGNLIYSHCVQKNVAVTQYVQGIMEIPWRTDVAHLDPFADYQLIKERYQHG